MQQEMAVAREAITLARSKFEPMEEENKDLRVQVMRLKEVGRAGKLLLDTTNCKEYYATGSKDQSIGMSVYLSIHR